MWTTVGIYGAILILIGGLIWAVGSISRKRGEAEIGGKIMAKQQKEAAKWRRALRERKRLHGRLLFKRMRKLGRKG